MPGGRVGDHRHDLRRVGYTAATGERQIVPPRTRPLRALRCCLLDPPHSHQGLSPEVTESRGWYNPYWHYERDPETRAALDRILNGHFSGREPEVFDPC